MALVKADRSACEGYGNCVVSAPDTFDVDDSGLVVLRANDFPAERRPEVEEAVRGCPAAALRIEDA